MRSPTKRVIETRLASVSFLPSDSKSCWWSAGAITILILLCYWQVWQFGFINYDDNDYVPKNSWIQNGYSKEAVNWAFTTGHMSNWHPLTWLSHILDWNIYGGNAGGHHFTNVLFHIANTQLLFLLLRKVTGATWRSALVAALFGLHPLHVESVAWVSERKDVLSVFFGLLSLWFYASYAQRKQRRAESQTIRSHRDTPGVSAAYAGALLFFGFSLMSKPMLVTMPFLMLLLDIWPLQRSSFLIRTSASNEISRSTEPLFNLIGEKLPFLLLTIGSSTVTFKVQAGKTMQTLTDFTAAARFSNAVVSYASYLANMLWPGDLAFFYPLLGAPPPGKVVLATVVLLLISALAVWARKRAPQLLIGWLWYLGTLIPVIGIVHVGDQSMADRYTYFPLIGIFIALVWGIAEWSGTQQRPLAGQQKVLTAAGLLILPILAFLSYRQVGFWKDSHTVLIRALEVTQNNFLAHNNYGVVLADSGNYSEAIKHYRQAIEIKPHYARAYSNLGASLALSGNFPEAIASLEKALSLRPGDAETHYNLAVTLAQLKDYPGTIQHCKAALELDPNYKVAHFDLALALSLMGENNEAVTHIREYLKAFPHDDAGHKLLSQTLQKISPPE